MPAAAYSLHQFRRIRMKTNNALVPGALGVQMVNARMRSLLVLLALIVSLIGPGATNAYATHYRYGTMYWEKDLTYTNPGFYKVRVTVLIGARWGFAWTILADAPPSANRCAGTPVFGDIPAGGSCPPVGAKIN